jgi:hypothetical protein
MVKACQVPRVVNLPDKNAERDITGPKAALAYAGLGILVTDGNDLFYDAKLPEGWKLEPTDHSMWSRIVDNQGQERVKIFYKAAFYDRSAFAVIAEPENG